MKNSWEPTYLIILISLIALQSVALSRPSIDTMSIKSDILQLEERVKEIDQRFNDFILKDDMFTDGVFSNTRYGVYFSPMLLNHNANFMMLDSFQYISCIQESYGSQINFGFHGGISFDYSLSRLLGISLKAGLGIIKNELISDEPLSYNHNGELKVGNIAHSISFNNISILLEPTIHFWISNNIFANVGARFASLIGKEFEQKETLQNVEPTYSFNNGSKERNIIKGDIPGMNPFQYGIQFGAGYELPLNKSGTILFVPELRAGINLSKVSSSLDWTTNQAALYLSLKYSPDPTKDSIPIERKQEIRTQDSIMLLAERQSILNKIRENENELTRVRLKAGEKELLFARIIKITDDSRQKELDKIQVEQIKTLRIIPLLNMLFFDSNSGKIPLRYKTINPNERISFSEEKIALSVEPLEIYYNLLNLIGKRMVENPSANITIVGCTDSKEAIQSGKQIANQRAEAVSYYLQNVWKIPNKRIAIQTRNLPEKFTSGDDEAAQQENRRVELISDNPAILAPVIAYDFISSEINPSKITTFISSKAGRGVKQWYMRAVPENQLTEWYVNKDNSIPSVPQFIDWDLSLNKEIFNDPGNSLLFEITVIDSTGQENAKEIKGVDIDFVTSGNRKLITKTEYNLMEFRILLPFDDPGLTEDNQRLMKFVTDNTKDLNLDDTQIFIHGYTDIMGTPERNINLSNERAKKVFNYFKQPKAIYEGKGVSHYFNNSIPEGRFYNRSVEMLVKPQ